jgi:hypothetical protein
MAGVVAEGAFEQGVVSVGEGTLLDCVGASASGTDCLLFANSARVANLLAVEALEDLRARGGSCRLHQDRKL